MADEYPITWGELIDFQSRVVSCRQALGHGMSRDAVSSRSQSGAWQRLHRGTYATFSGVPRELDGRSSHPPEQKWQDADRDNDNLFAGDVQTVRFGVRDVTVRRCARAAQLAAVLMWRGWDGSGLHACDAGCQVTVRNSPGSAEVPRMLRSS